MGRRLPIQTTNLIIHGGFSMRSFKNVFVLALLGSVAGGLVGYGILLAEPQLGKQTSPPKVKVDSSPISKETMVRGSYADMIEKTGPSVVYIYTSKKVDTRNQSQLNPFFEDPFFRRFFGPPRQYRSPSMPPQEQRGLGSGVIISEDGYILTNNHVIADADEIEVVLSDDDESFTAEVIGTDPKTDIAVIKIKAKDLPAITLGDSDHLRVGDVVLAIGNPFGIGKTVTMGIVSAKGRGTLHMVDYENFIQTDAAINPGNSGGALVDAEGRLIGINTAIVSRSGGYQGVGFAVPINMARNVMDNLVEHGEVRRGFLGVGIQSVNADLAEAFGLDSAAGALVAQVEPDTPAERAGLQEGDVIVELDGEAVKNSQEFRLSIAETPPGESVALKIVRDGRSKKVDVTLGALEEDSFGRGGNWSGKPSARITVLDGIQIDDLDARWRQRFQIPSRISGVVVVDMDPSSVAYKAGIRPGDVILSIGRQTVETAEEAINLSRELEENRVLLRVWSRGSSRYVVVEGSND